MKQMVKILREADHGAPRHLRSDNGPEFVSRAVLRWLTQANIDTAHIEPGKPWQNGSNESFNGKFRDECLSLQWFNNRIDAKILIETFRHEYNEVRPHSSLGQLTPILFEQTLSTTTPTATSPKHTGPKKAGRSPPTDAPVRLCFGRSDREFALRLLTIAAYSGICFPIEVRQNLRSRDGQPSSNLEGH